MNSSASAAPESTEIATSTPLKTNFVRENENKKCQGVAEAPPPLVNVQPPIAVEKNENQNLEGSRSGSGSDANILGRRMYRAVLSDDWATAKMLLKQDPKLVYDVITERGDRALHLSIAMKHKKFAQKLIESMRASDLEWCNGFGYTACCYAAISAEMVETAHLLIRKNERVVGVRNREKRIPLQMASSSGKHAMILFLFNKTPIECLSRDEWFGLLLNSIATKMFDIALLILGRDGYLATMRNEEGTALHVLARQDISEASTSKSAILLKSILGTTFYGRQIYGEMKPDCRHLAQELLAKIQEHLKHEIDEVELLKRPPILHDAAKVGNVELIVMLTHAYPDLLWQTGAHHGSIFHIAVIYRQDNVFGLIRQIGGMKNLVVMGVNADGNNILHLAAKLGPLNSRKNIVSISALQMQRELAWFKEVEAIVPPTFIEMRNGAGQTPREVFSEEHGELLRESETWMRSTADSCMLIATIILTVVYAAAFTVPGGSNGETGLPILVRSNWFTCFFVFEALALFGSTLCIIVFWSITSSGFKEERFLDILPYQLKLGISGLFGSLIGAVSAFMSAYCLVLVEEREWLVKSVVLVIYVMLVLAICGRFSELWFKMKLPKYLPRVLSHRNSQSLFSPHHTSGI